MLWLSIHLPWLTLEVFGCDGDQQPLAVVEGQRIVLATPAAVRAGVRNGVKISAAQAICPSLLLGERRHRAESRALRRLANWSLQFTPTVTMQPPATVLLEIGGSLHYFDGLDPLRERIRAGLATLGYRHRIGVAPTPAAAWLLSLAGDERPIMSGQSIDRRLSPLPLNLLVTDVEQHKALEGLGLTTIGECLVLPRTGLARRLGRDLVQRLDRALGRQPDPRRPYRPPSRFRGRVELPMEVIHTDQMSFALNRLIHELCGFLQGTGNGAQRLWLALEHLHHPATGFELGTLEPNRDPGYLMALLRERLERVEPAAPVIAVALEAQRLQRLEQEPMPLLEPEPAAGERHWTQLLERLSAHLGEPRIRGLAIHSEHRPERAWRYAPPGEQNPAQATPPERPLWLFSEPRLLQTRSGQPLWQGALTLQHGPECIESGWWDGGDVRRDYYVAITPGGARLWVFRERRPPRRWYLHGMFA